VGHVEAIQVVEHPVQVKIVDLIDTLDVHDQGHLVCLSTQTSKSVLVMWADS
jgi:hypothetical protein